MAGKPPYAGVVIRRGEVNWIVHERGWSTDNFRTLEQAIDFRRVGVRDAIMSHVDLGFANLSGAVLDNSNFSGSSLPRANLSSTYIWDCNFGGAQLIGANLSGAVIVDSNFSGATLTFAHLSDASIAGNFKNADLTQARMDGATILGSSLTQERWDTLESGSSAEVAEKFTFQLDATTRLLDVSWNGAVLSNVSWQYVPRLGDEADIKDASSRKDRVQALRDAARAYQGLAKALQAQGLTIPAQKYRTREHQLERRALLYSFAIGPWLFFELLSIMSGYGDKPRRALACYLAVVGAFTGVYWSITNQVFGFIASNSAHLAWYEELVLSISSFHGRGFFPSTLSLGDPIALVAAAEAIIGLFIELVFIATFTQRFFAR